MLNKACTSPADVTFIKDIRDKYHRPNNTPHLLVPIVNASIYRKMSRFQKDLITAFKRPKEICVGVFMQLHCCQKNYINWKKIIQKMKYYRTCTHFQRMHCFYHHIPPSCNQLPGAIIWSTYLQGPVQETHKITHELYGSAISETFRATTIMLLKYFYQLKNFSYKFLSRK